MVDQKKLDRWADKLLDTGKRNNLINFRDTKASSAEVLFPDCESVFSKCSVGHLFEVFDPKIPDEDFDESEELQPESTSKKLSKKEYKELYGSRIRNDRHLLVYAQTPNPITAVKNIAKKAKSMQDETGINVAYLAFGFVKWNEKEGSEYFYNAPLLLVHVNIITGTVLEPVKIEISDDDVVINPTFDYKLQADHGLSLPTFEDGDTLASYYAKVSALTQRMGWEVIDECKLGVFSFLKINMYEDLKNNSEQILENDNVKALLGGSTSGSFNFSGVEHVVDNPLIDLHTVVDADSSQIEAVEMAKSGQSFVLQGPPGTGKSQTITNIIAECLYDGKKILFVSEKQAALNVVYDKLKKVGLADFCLELHSHKANKKAVIEELNRTLEIPKSAVSSSAQEEIRQKREAQIKLDEYARELHKKREVINKSLYQLFEAYSAERNYPELQVNIRNIQSKGNDYFLLAIKLLEQYAEYMTSIGQNYKRNVWYGFNDPSIGYDDRNVLREALVLVLQGYQDLRETTVQIKNKYETKELNYAETVRWQGILELSAGSDAIAPAIMSKEAYDYAYPQLVQMKELSAQIIPAREKIRDTFNPEVIDKYNGEDLHTKLTGQFSGVFSRLFSGDYKNLIAGIQPYVKSGEKLKYQHAVDFSEQLMKYQSAMKAFTEKEATIRQYVGSCYQGADTDWEHVLSSLQKMQSYFDQETPEFGAISNMSSKEFDEGKTAFQNDADKLTNVIDSINTARETVSRYFDKETLDLDKNSYEYCVSKIRGCVTDFEKLGNWIAFMGLLDQLSEAELSSYIDLVIGEQLKAESVVGAYRRAYYKQWIEYVIFSVPEITSFSRIKQDQAVQSFVSKDSLQYEISKVQIKSELSQQRPNLDMVAGGGKRGCCATSRGDEKEKANAYPQTVIRNGQSCSGNQTMLPYVSA